MKKLIALSLVVCAVAGVSTSNAMQMNKNGEKQNLINKTKEDKGFLFKKENPTLSESACCWCGIGALLCFGSCYACCQEKTLLEEAQERYQQNVEKQHSVNK